MSARDLLFRRGLLTLRLIPQLYPPCLYCGEATNGIDHIIARACGGGDEDNNLAPCCPGCNSSKNYRSVEWFLRNHRDILARVRAYQAGEDVLSGLTPGVKPRSPVGGY